MLYLTHKWYELVLKVFKFFEKYVWSYKYFGKCIRKQFNVTMSELSEIRSAFNIGGISKKILRALRGPAVGHNILFQ